MSDESDTSKKSSIQTKKMTVKTEKDKKAKQNTGSSNDDFFISPFLIIGLFFAALGFGFLLPGVGGFNAPSYQSWSIIIAGLVICIPGVIQTVQKYRKNKKTRTKSKQPQ